MHRKRDRLIGFSQLKQFLQVAVAGKVAGKVDCKAGQRIGGRDVAEMRSAVFNDTIL